jgi:hypothetical protein
MNPEQIARIAHEVNRAYCQALGDNTQPMWEDAPDWQRASVIAGVALHTQNPWAGPEASHACWLEEKQRAGWRYGLKKDPVAKTHPCMVDFVALPVDQRAKDFIFRAVVLALAPILPVMPVASAKLPNRAVKLTR